MTIWKFSLKTVDEQFITVPVINRPLCVQVQDITPCLWMIVDPDSECIKARVRIFGTGHPGVTSDMDYVGTYQVSGGALVFHVFLAGAFDA